MKWIKVILCYLFSLPAFANLPYYPIQFPRDEAAHHANVPYEIKHLTEWWYFSGKLTTASPTARNFGYFIAVFNIIPPGNAEPEAVLMMQLTNLDNQKVYGTTKIFSAKDAMFATDKLDIRLGDKFHMTMDKSSYYIMMEDLDVPGLQHKLTMMISATPTKSPLLINKNGLFDMYDDTNTYYYSNARMHTVGFVDIGDSLYNIDGSSSSSWMDHQWGDFILTPLRRWIWTSAQLDNGIDFSAFELIDSKTKKIIRKLANVIMPDNSRFYTDDITIQASDRDARSHYPSRYDVVIHPLNLQINLNSLAPHQNTNGFWEGAHAAVGQYNSSPLTGFSYVENTVEYQRHK